MFVLYSYETAHLTDFQTMAARKLETAADLRSLDYKQTKPHLLEQVADDCIVRVKVIQVGLNVETNC
jgi:hypothetical protein